MQAHPLHRVAPWAAAFLALVPWAAPVDAQEWGVVRQSYRYADTRLVVNVRADVPGEIQIVRGSRGYLDVAARAERGIAGMALGGHRREELVLTSMGAERVLYLVTVPENTRVDVRLPGQRFGQTFWPPRDMARFTWGPPATPASTAAEGAPAPASASAQAPAQGPYTALSAPRAPALVDVPAGAAVRSLVVRIEDVPAFRVETERPLRVAGPGRRELRLDPRGEPVELVLVLPLGTRDFVLRLGDDEVLRVRDGEARALCGPVIDQWLAGERRRITFTPAAGGLECPTG